MSAGRPSLAPLACGPPGRSRTHALIRSFAAALGLIALLPGGLTGQGEAAARTDPPPSPPGTVTATPTGPTSILVAWSAVTDAEGGVKHYVVYRDGNAIGTSASLSLQDTGLTANTTYSYQVATVDSKDREGQRSSSVTATTPADATPPTTPTGLQASAAGPGQVDLTWQPASDAESGVASYRVYRDGAFLASTSATSFSDTGVQPQTTYSYEVSAVNGAGLEGSRSAPASVTTSDTTPPAPPRRLRIVRNPG